MNRIKINTEKGLTLLELILALTILSFILWASSSLSLSATRLLDSFVSGEIQLQNELRYVIHYLEGDLRGGREPIVNCKAGQPCTIRVTDADGTRVTYQYSPVSREMARTEGNIPTAVISTGTLIQRIKNGVAQPIFDFARDSDGNPIDENKLVQVSLSAQRTTKDGSRTITLPGISETIMLRGV